MLPNERIPDRGRLVRGLMLSVLAGVVIYIGTMIASGYEEIARALSSLGPAPWAVILGLSLVNYAARFLRWRWYLRHLGYGIPMSQDLACYLGGFAFTTTPGKAGEAIRSIYLSKHGVSYRHSLAVFFAEKLLDLAALAALAMLAALHFPETQLPVLLCAAALFACISLLRSHGLWASLEPRLRRLMKGGVASIAQQLVSLVRASASLLGPRTLYGGLLIGLVGWAAEGIAFYGILRWMDVDASLTVAIGIYAFSTVVGALSFIPGGLGSTEAVMGLLLIAIGAGPAQAMAATIACRVATLWFAVVIGMIALGSLEAARALTPRAGLPGVTAQTVSAHDDAT